MAVVNKKVVLNTVADTTKQIADAINNQSSAASFAPQSAAVTNTAFGNLLKELINGSTSQKTSTATGIKTNSTAGTNTGANTGATNTGANTPAAPKPALPAELPATHTATADNTYTTGGYSGYSGSSNADTSGVDPIRAAAEAAFTAERDAAKLQARQAYDANAVALDNQLRGLDDSYRRQIESQNKQTEKSLSYADRLAQSRGMGRSSYNNATLANINLKGDEAIAEIQADRTNREANIEAQRAQLLTALRQNLDAADNAFEASVTQRMQQLAASSGGSFASPVTINNNRAVEDDLIKLLQSDKSLDSATRTQMLQTLQTNKITQMLGSGGIDSALANQLMQQLSSSGKKTSSSSSYTPQPQQKQQQPSTGSSYNDLIFGDAGSRNYGSSPKPSATSPAPTSPAPTNNNQGSSGGLTVGNLFSSLLPMVGAGVVAANAFKKK